MTFQTFKITALAACVGVMAFMPLASQASSHREAPFITTQPKVDATDFYMFRSYETGRAAYVTLVANYLPLQDPYGGPNYFSLNENALYEIHIDNDGDAIEDITFQFDFNNEIQDIALTVGGVSVPIPLKQAGAITAADTSKLNVIETYAVDIVRGDRRSSAGEALTGMATGDTSFVKPVDNIGNKTIANYAAYANSHIYDVVIPGCATPGKMFVGQRKDSFVVNLGETFDLINIADPIADQPGDASKETNSLANKNVTTIALEVPIACLVAGGDGSGIIGGWTTASKRQARVLNPQPMGNDTAIVNGGAWTQVSRLGHPLVNEVVIGLPDKNAFNASEPKDDAQFATYVTNPTLPELVEILFGSAGVVAPDVFPRTDLVSVFLTGVDGLNQPPNVVASEMLRLNTAIPPVPAATQDPLGVLGGDTAGFPNGRRPGDDVVDISLRAAMGALLEPNPNATGELPFTDGAYIDATMFNTTFPYLLTPIPGSPAN